MPTIKDFYCSECDFVEYDVWIDSVVDNVLTMECSVCKKTTNFKPLCNGGIKSRWRYVDLPNDPEYYRGQVKAMDVTATDAEGNPVKSFKGGGVGGVLHDEMGLKNGHDRREERRDRISSDRKRKRGSTPLTFDGGKTK